MSLFRYRLFTDIDPDLLPKNIELMRVPHIWDTYDTILKVGHRYFLVESISYEPEPSFLEFNKISNRLGMWELDWKIYAMNYQREVETIQVIEDQEEEDHGLREPAL